MMKAYRTRLVIVATLLASLVAADVRALQVAPPSVSAGTAPAPQESTRAAVPFGVGEKLTYDVNFGPIRAGSASMEVRGIDQVRGQEAWHTYFQVKGGIPLYRVHDVFESWIHTGTLSSLRFVKDLDEGPKEREHRYEIYPEQQVFRETTDDDGGTEPSVANPLDDGSFLYFIRTVPLVVGRTYEFNRYFRPDRNPVTIRVLRTEQVRVPAGTFDAIVIQPIIKTNGIFSEKGSAEIWLSNDDRRIMLQMKSKLSFGSLNLYLNSYRPAPGGAGSSGS